MVEEVCLTRRPCREGLPYIPPPSHLARTSQTGGLPAPPRVPRATAARTSQLPFEIIRKSRKLTLHRTATRPPGDREIKKTKKSKKTQGKIKKTRKRCDSFSFLTLRGEKANTVVPFSRFLDFSSCFLAFLGFLDFLVPGGQVATKWSRRRFDLPRGLVEKVCLTRRPNREGLPSDDNPIEKVCLPRERERPPPSHPYLIEKKSEKERGREGERERDHHPATLTLPITTTQPPLP